MTDKHLRRAGASYQKGSAHVVLFGAIFIALVSALGFVAYSSYRNQPSSAGSANTLGSAAGTAADSVSSISIKNFRDASTTTGGTVLKKAVLYRSPQLSSISSSQKSGLERLLAGKDARIIDLRTEAQANASPDKNIRGVRKVSAPMNGFHETSSMVSDRIKRQQLAKALRMVIANRGPVLVHCTVGKDRTGWVVAMIMYIAGASDRQVYKEYAKSTEAYPSHDADWIKSGVSLAKKKYGSINGYLKKGVGLSDLEIRKLRNKFKA
ncbi:MAG TPA: tyrosine-protein phosphatase [Candidatus Saccharimonadales bacterium]